jgi:antitoxin component of MazEF toxin-antitoxin module
VIKTLQRVGNSHAVIIDRPIMDLLHMEPGSLVMVEVLPDGTGLSIRPASHGERVNESSKRMMAKHDKAMRKLAE